MKKKIVFVSFLLVLFFLMPFVGANAATNPSDFEYSTTAGKEGTKELVTNDGFFNFDGTTIEITSVNDTWTNINLNQSIIIDFYQGEDHFKAILSEVVSLDPLKFALIISIEMKSFETANTSLSILLPDGIEIFVMKDNLGFWTFEVNEFTILWFEETRIFDVFCTDFHIHVENHEGFEYILVNFFGSLIEFYRWDVRSWIVSFMLTYIVNATYIPPKGAGTLDVVYEKPPALGIPVFTDFPTYPNLAWYDGEFLTIAFIESVLIIAHDGYVISIYEDKAVLEIFSIAIIIYYATIIERIVIMFFEYTIIYYFTFHELILVIIWETIEIKLYHYQIVLVYEIYEIIILFFEYHFEVNIFIHIVNWVIEIRFLIMIFNPLIIQPVVWRIIPILVPLMVPMYFFIPVYITEFTYIYLPYLAEQILIDVHKEQLEKPTHIIDYFVYDQTKTPIPDATVSVSYNGTSYSTSHQGNGIYRVQLPAYDEAKVISVTATKPFYPDGNLIYILEVNWTSSTVTTTLSGSFPLIASITALFVMAICSIISIRKKRC